MDGTLIDSGTAISNTINFVRTNIGLEPLDKSTLLTQINNPNINAAEYFYGTQHFTEEQTELFTQYYDKHCIEDIVLYNGIKNLLKKLSTHFILCVATNASKEFAIKMLKHLDIYKYFKLVVGANCVKNPKPSPDMLQYICKKLSIKCQDTILVGDSLKDQLAADNCQMDTILVDWGFSNNDLKNYKVIKDIKELTNILQNY